MNPSPQISISVVSHGQMGLVADLLDDIEKYCRDSSLELLLTLNLQSDEPPATERYSFPMLVIRNGVPKGFGANHNHAFTYARGGFFCVLNPDVRLGSNPFAPLIEALGLPNVGIAAPVVRGIDGAIEDSARSFPTPLAIIRRLVTGRHTAVFPQDGAMSEPDWIGGMFMLFSNSLYKSFSGFNERYFLYYEDVDLCARLRLSGFKTVVCNGSSVIHCAQRSSHKSFKFFRLHFASLIRFFTSATWFRLWARGYL